MDIVKKKIEFSDNHFFLFLIKKFFFLFLLLFVFFPWAVHGTASYRLNPSSGTYETKKVFPIDVIIRGRGDTVKANLRFDSNLLEVESISEAKSVVEIWSPGGRPRYSNSEGTVSFSGGIPGGVRASEGNIITINFKGKRTGEASVTFLDGDILEAGESIISDKGSAVYILKQGTSASEHDLIPDPQNSVPVPDDFFDVEETLFERLLNIEFDNENDPTNPTPVFIFKQDLEIPKTDYYEIILNNELHEVFSFEDDSDDKRYRISLLTPGYYSLEVRAFDKDGKYVFGVTEFSILPILLEVDKINSSIREEKHLNITGKTFPRATVKIYFSKNEEESPDVMEIKANDDGNFIFQKSLLEGKYEIWLEAEDERGALSNTTEKITVRVTSQKRWIFILALMLIVLILIGIFFIWIFHRRIKNKKKELENGNNIEIKKKARDVIEEKVREQINYLENKVDLSRSESKLLSELKNALESSREILERNNQK